MTRCMDSGEYVPGPYRNTDGTAWCPGDTNEIPHYAEHAL